jgi:hypothetical protein
MPLKSHSREEIRPCRAPKCLFQASAQRFKADTPCAWITRSRQRSAADLCDYIERSLEGARALRTRVTQRRPSAKKRSMQIGGSGIGAPDAEFVVRSSATVVPEPPGNSEWGTSLGTSTSAPRSSTAAALGPAAFGNTGALPAPPDGNPPLPNPLPKGNCPEADELGG